MTEPSEPAAPASVIPSPDDRLVGGRYRLGAVIGRGGMATVHVATDIRLDRRVAVKLLRPEVTADADLAQRFRREALAATVLRHPNIVACLDTGTDGAQPYLIMELVDGEDLAARLKRGGRLEPWVAARIGLDVARALGVAHVRGIVHRDVKPGNILLATDGRAKVTDFGIARLAMDAEASMPGTTLGSVHYFSPEQARGATTTPASDVYGLGLVLYESLTGSRPWSGDSNDAIALARVGTTAPSVRATRPEVPAPLAAVVARALAPEALDRYPNGAAMALALEPIVAAGDPSSPTAVVVLTSADRDLAPSIAADPAAVPPTPAPVPVSAARRARRGPNVLVILVALVGLVLGAAAVASLPGDNGQAGVLSEPPSTEPADETIEPTVEPTVAPSADATAEPTPQPAPSQSDTPTDVPAGEVADLCETFFDLPCSLGAGRYAPSRFAPAFDMELGDGWSTAAHAPDVVVLGRDEGLLTFLSGEIVIDPDGQAITTRGRPRDIIEALVTLVGVSSTPPADIRIDRRRGVSIDVAPVDPSRIALLGNGGSTFYLEPDRTTRVLAIDVRGTTVVMIIEPKDGTDLRSILETADPAAGTIRWR